jgi:hypothetical protein
MAVKVLVNEIGQQIIADVKQVNNKDTEQLVAYWVREPRAILYRAQEDNTVSVDFTTPIPITSETEYAIAAHHIVTIVEPTESVLEHYLAIVSPPPAELEPATPAAEAEVDVEGEAVAETAELPVAEEAPAEEAEAE